MVGPEPCRYETGKSRSHVGGMALDPNTLLYTILAFSFGVVFVSTLLLFAVFFPAPSVFQEFVFRAVLSLAAAGVVAVIPGILRIELQNWVSVGGALAVFAVIFWFNPPELVKPLKAAELRDRAGLAILSGNYGLAKELLQSAIALAPDEAGYVNALAQVEYSLGNYSTAKILYEKAYDTSGLNGGAKDKRYLYTISLIYEADGKLDDAIQNYEDIRKTLEDGSDTWNDLIFSEGQIYLKKALYQHDPKDSLFLLRKSEELFNIFLENKGSPTQWAKYHLACIHSIFSLDKQSGAVKADGYEKQALEEIRETAKQIREYKGKTAKDHYEMLSYLMNPVSFFPWRPGYPVECPPLRALVAKNTQVLSFSSSNFE